MIDPNGNISTGPDEAALAARANGLGVMLAALGLAFTLLLAPEPARAQFPPDSFTNLKVLPKDIESRALINTMRGFARGLGVRCEFCHVGEAGQPLSSFDFAADDKATKRKAREMLKMVNGINTEHLANLEERSDPAIAVTCATCHHGVSKPQTTQALLMEAYQGGGIESALAKYRELREEYYGTYAYDFSQSVLGDVAQQLVGAGQLDDAVDVLALNLELFPNSVLAQSAFALFSIEQTILAEGVEAGIASYHAHKNKFLPRAFHENMLNSIGYRLMLVHQRLPEAIGVFKLNVEIYPDAFNAYDSLGEAYMANDEKELAIKSYERSLELNPANTNAVEMLKKIRSGG